MSLIPDKFWYFVLEVCQLLTPHSIEGQPGGVANHKAEDSCPQKIFVVRRRFVIAKEVDI